MAFSIAALSTYVLAPEMGCAFDMGDCLLEATSLQHVFITHAHGDHTRCLLRHHALRRLLGMDKATYYVPQETVAGFKQLAHAWQALELGTGRAASKYPPQTLDHKMPNLQPMHAGSTIMLHQQLGVKAFAVQHGPPSLGYTVFDVRKKLKPQYHGTPGHALAKLRQKGVCFEEEKWSPRLTFIGDSTIETLHRQPHIGDSKILFLEVTFLMDDERSLAKKRGHTHVEDLAAFLREKPDALPNPHIVLKHFSMRYQREQILYTLKQKLPPEFMHRVHVLV